MAQLLIYRDRFKNNLDIIKNHISQNSKNNLSAENIGLVMKDNGYGHGIKQIAELAMKYGIKSVFVKNEFEALLVAGSFKHVTALYGCLSDSAPKNIYATIHKIEDIENLLPNRGVELKINSGMNRNGISIEDIQKAVEAILKNRLNLVGVFTHNGYGDELDSDFENQQNRFREIRYKIEDMAKKLGFKPPRFHSLSTSGTLRSENIDDDLVRVGIGAYGYIESSFEVESAKNLTPIAELYADRIATQKLKKGDRIGYSGVSILKEDCNVSTYDIGYGDGFYRLTKDRCINSADGYTILPNSSMDCLSAICNKDRICLMNDAKVVAKLFGTISYEVLTRISPFIDRKIL